MALNNLTRVTSSGFGTNTNINTAGIITAASFSGDGSGLTGITALGSGVVVQEEGSNVGTAQTINFIGTGVTATFSGGIASVEITTSSGGGGGGLSNVVEDTTPQLGGNLDLNSNNITGTGDINITGDATFSGDLDVDGHVDLDNVSVAGVSTFSGTTEVQNSSFRVTNSSASGQYLQVTQNSNSSLNLDKVGDGAFYIRGNNIYLQNDGSSETYAGFEANGRSYLNYDASTKFETTNTGAVVTGILTATSFSGDGSTLTGLTGASAATYGNGTVVPQITVDANGRITTIANVSISGGGGGGGTTMFIRDSGSLVGAAGTIDFGTNLSVSPVSAGIVTVTGSIAGINTSATSEFTNIDVDGHTDLDNVTIAGVVTATTLVKSGGTSSQFLKADGTVDSSTYLTSYTETDPVVGAINGIVKADGAGNISAASAGTDYLTPSGDGSSLTGIGAAFTNVQATWSLSANGTSAYRFTGPGNDGTEDNPDIYLVRGQKYRFTNNTGGSHPFEIRSSAGGSAYSDGVTNNNAASGNIEINVQHDAPARLFYQCSSHSAMVGNIYVVGGSDWRMTDVNTSTDPEIYTDRYVGIGTDNPGYKLDVRPTPSDPTSGSPPAGAFVQIRGDDATVGSGPSLALLNLGGTKETAWRISAVSTSGNNGDLVFNGYAGGATYPEAARFTSAGNLKFPSGQGIDFSATADGSGTTTSELLDDYEEGSWTPAVARTSPTGSATHTRQSGRYTRIGNVVTIWFDIEWSAAPNGAGDYVITSLPYTAQTGVSAGVGGFGAVQFRDPSGLSSNIRIYGNSSYHSDTRIFCQHYDSSGNPGNSPFNASGRITGWSQYFV